MDAYNDLPTAGFSLDQVFDFADHDNDEHLDTWDTLVDEIDAWGRHALAANGFGDY